MVRTKNAGDRTEGKGGRREGDRPTRDKGKASAVRAETNALPSNAQKRFDEALAKGKIFIAERGIPRLEVDQSDNWLAAEVAKLGWSTFCAPREPAVIPVVREFYALVPDHRHGKINLRGTTVKFDANTINRSFQLPIPNYDEYEQFVGSALTAPKADAVRQILTDGRGRWTTYNGEFVSLTRKSLQGRAKAWFYFVVFSLMPVTHHNLCRRDPAVLIYAILQGLAIDVGKIIFRGILQSSEITKGYWFPSLITMLCRQAGVPMGAHEETLQPGTLMTVKYVNKLYRPQDTRDGDDETNGAGPSAAAALITYEQPDERGPPDVEAPAAAETEILQFLRQIQRENRRTRREFRLRHEHIEENMRRNDANMQFYWSAAGYDLTQYQSMTAWADSSQAAQWNEGDGEEENDDEQHESSAED